MTPAPTHAPTILTAKAHARWGSAEYAIAAVALLAASAAITVGPLYALPLVVLVFWYAIARVTTDPTVLLIWIALYSLLGDKMIVSTGVGGGQGLLRLAPIINLALLAALFLVDGHTRSAINDVVYWGAPAALFVTVGAALPLLGPLSGSPLRTVTGAIPLLAMGASLVFGVLVARSDIDHDRARYLVLLSVSWVAAGAGVLLFLFNRGITLPLAREIHLWGLATAESYGNTWLIGRTSGLYTSPNVLGTLGGLTVLYAVFGRLASRQRAALAVPALAILFVTQSRMVILATGASIALGVLFGERRAGMVRWQAIVSWVLVAVVLGAAVIGVSTVFPQYIQSLTTRISAIAHVFSEGATADRNLAGRVGFWQSAWALFQQHPLGTFGPPELALGTAVDNDYLRFALQGGVLYAGVWILYLAWLTTTGLARHGDKFIGAGGVFLTFTALTQISSTYTMVIGVFSLFVGMHIERIRQHRLSAGTRQPSQQTGVI